MKRFVRPQLIALALFAGAVLASPVRAAVWNFEETRISGVSGISLTSITRRSIAAHPDGSLVAVWYERTGPRSSSIRIVETTIARDWNDVSLEISTGDSLSRNPGVAVDPEGGIHVSWEDNRHNNEEIYYRYRSPAGIWSPEERVTNEESPSRTPVLGVSDAGRVHLIWSDNRAGNFEIYHRYRDPGSDWSPTRRLTEHEGVSIEPVFEIDTAGDIHLIWRDDVLNPLPGEVVPGNAEIYYQRLTADGLAASSAFRVSNGTGISQHPTMALGRDGALHVFWADNRDITGGIGRFFPFAIWYRRWLPGLGFGHEKRFMFSGTDRVYPAVAAGPDGTVNVVWEDFSHGNTEIYFRQIHPVTGWDVSGTRITYTVGPTRSPGLIADEQGQLHLVWSDTGSGGEEQSVRYISGHVDATTPVVMSWSRADWIDRSLVVSWETASELNHAGFMVYGCDDPHGESVLLTARPLTGGPGYEFRLDNSPAVRPRYLKLVAVSRDGSLETVALVTVPEPGAPPDRVRLGAPYPNPSPGGFSLPVFGDGRQSIEVDVLDVQGRRVSRHDLGRPAAGRVDFEIGRSAALAPGRYWLRLKSNGRPTGSAVGVVVVR